MTEPQPASVYDLAHEEVPESSATFAVLVDNEPGVLHRVVGLFAARGYNIESLTVAETDKRQNLSRITVVTSGTRMIIEQIKNQLQHRDLEKRLQAIRARLNSYMHQHTSIFELHVPVV